MQDSRKAARGGDGEFSKMAVLIDNDRHDVWAEAMRLLARLGPCAITKIQLRNAINAIDSWTDTNASAFNQALPVAARLGLTETQKAALLSLVVRRRWEVSNDR